MKFRPAFVVTLAVAAPACARNTAPQGPVQATPTASAATATIASSPPPPQAPRKRRAVAEQKWVTYQGALDLADAKQLNPRDAKGREIRTVNDGRCYVELPFPTGAPIPPPGSAPPIEVVDCPDSMQDAAWDTCLAGPLYQLANGDCVCLLSGNPPPPPLTAGCPADVKR